MTSSPDRAEPAGQPAYPDGQPAYPDGQPVKAAAVPSLELASAAGPGGRSRAGQGIGVPAIPGVSRRPVPLAAVLPLADAAALTAALVAASVAAGRPGWPAAAYSVTALLALSVSGMQRLRICTRVSDQAGRMLAAVTAPALVLLPWTPAPIALRLVLWSAGLVLAFRVAVTTGLRAGRRRGCLTEPALLVGAGSAGEQILGLLREHPELGLRPCGFIDSLPLASTPGLPVLGGPADLAEVVARHAIRRVIVCFPAAAARPGHSRAQGLP